MRIVCLGDSLTWGKYGGSYVDELARLLPQHTFINAGDGGDMVLNLLRRVDDDVIAAEPDAAFVIVGGNDAISYAYPSTRPYYTQVKKIPNGYLTPDQFEQTYRDLLTRLQLAHVMTWIALPPSERNPELVEVLATFNARARAAASSFNVSVLDLQAVLAPSSIPERAPIDLGLINLIGRRMRDGWRDYETERAQGSFTFTFDGLHPTPEGAQRMAEAIAAFIES